MSDQIIKVTDDNGVEKSLTFPDDISMSAFLVKSRMIEAIETQASRWETLAKSTGDRELSRYYAERAKSAAGQAAGYRELAANHLSASQAASVTKALGQVYGKTPVVRKDAVKANRPVKVENDLANETQRRAFIAQAEAAEAEMREHQRKADEAERVGNSSSDRTIYRHYQDRRLSIWRTPNWPCSRAASFRLGCSRVFKVVRQCQARRLSSCHGSHTGRPRRQCKP